MKVEPGKAPEHEKKDQANDKIEIGAKIIKTPSGIGFVATGIGAYRTMENPIATRIAKRKAYVIAFTNAKKRLAEILGGSATREGRDPPIAGQHQPAQGGNDQHFDRRARNR